MAHTVSDIVANFARLTPTSQRTLRAFNDAVSYMKDVPDGYHLKFAVLEEDDQSDWSASTVAGPSDGYFKFHVGLQNPKRGWLAGKGDDKFQYRGVELLLTRPDSKESDNIHSKQCLFKLHPRTGIIVVKATTPSSPVRVEENGELITLLPGETRALCQRRTRLMIGPFLFDFEYTFPFGNEFELRGELRQILLGEDGHEPPIDFCYIPMDKGAALRGDFYVSTATRGSGSFGWVHSAISKRTGESAAVKALRIKNDRDRGEAMNEIRAWGIFTVSYAKSL